MIKYDLRAMTTWVRPWRLLICAATFHLGVTLLVCALGRSGLVPSTIDSSGIAVSVAPDGAKFLGEVNHRSAELAGGQFRAWCAANAPFHVRLYSISFAALRPLFGETILSAEPVNSIYFVAILALVFLLGGELFDRRAAFCAALIVGLWPSLLLHTTQLVRDPLFIAAMLGFILANVRLLSPKLSWRSGLVTAIAGGLLGVLVWFSRDTMGEIVIAIASLTIILLLVRQLLGRSETYAVAWRLRAPALVSAVLLLMFAVAATAMIPKFRRTTQDDGWQNSRYLRRNPLIVASVNSSNPWSRFVGRVGKLREGFALEFSDAGSNVDANVLILTTKDLVFYLPRAAMIGFFAPFPRMWFSAGNQISLSGRMFSGGETLALYVFEICAVATLWQRRRQLSVWFVWLSASAGLVALGLVVINVGAIYRLRYVFAIMLIVLATPSLLSFFDRFNQRKTQTFNHPADHPRATDA